MDPRVSQRKYLEVPRSVVKVFHFIMCYLDISQSISALSWPLFRVAIVTGQRWIPHRKASDVELWCFLLSVSEYTVEYTILMLVIWDDIGRIVTSLQWVFIISVLQMHSVLPKLLYFRTRYSSKQHNGTRLICFMIYSRLIPREIINNVFSNGVLSANMYNE